LRSGPTPQKKGGRTYTLAERQITGKGTRMFFTYRSPTFHRGKNSALEEKEEREREVQTTGGGTYNRPVTPVVGGKEEKRKKNLIIRRRKERELVAVSDSVRCRGEGKEIEPTRQIGLSERKGERERGSAYGKKKCLCHKGKKRGETRCPPSSRKGEGENHWEKKRLKKKKKKPAYYSRGGEGPSHRKAAFLKRRRRESERVRPSLQKKKGGGTSRCPWKRRHKLNSNEKGTGCAHRERPFFL